MSFPNYLDFIHTDHAFHAIQSLVRIKDASISYETWCGYLVLVEGRLTELKEKIQCIGNKINQLQARSTYSHTEFRKLIHANARIHQIIKRVDLVCDLVDEKVLSNCGC